MSGQELETAAQNRLPNAMITTTMREQGPTQKCFDHFVVCSCLVLDRDDLLQKLNTKHAVRGQQN